MSKKIIINGKEVSTDVDGNMPLLWYLRDEVDYTGTKFGCGMGLCGACTVHIDGKAVRSCITPVNQALGKKVTTIEGLSENGDHPLQKAWVEHKVPQCGYCQAGQIMNAASLLAENPNPSADQIEQGMQGNICRCGTYNRIKKAIASAAEKMQEA
ncbi:(2Fe-2S)-binding protein [Aliikangiella marina]|uniref:(2Fe-2S)-binding protein n=1 Tax=Aliikangiella marina TaxID=1712262 RepID=A0A545T6E6_9GAMM|nr:(2Fe-2S)-binding protein [Aliikangiella marina]TQV72793.1 (2Fe-2S)-binding protein [Aliikangiella marina]